MRRMSTSLGSVLGGEWRGTDDGGHFLVGGECAVLRNDGLRVSCEQSGNVRPELGELGVCETDLATKYTSARVRGGDVGHQGCSRDRVDGIW